MANRHLGEGMGGRAVQSEDRLSNWKTNVHMIKGMNHENCLQSGALTW